MKIDIHSHIIFNIDDGSKSFEQSKIILKQAKKIGVNSIICTPHFKKGTKEKILKVKQNFIELYKYAKELDINLYIGNEIMYSDEMISLLKENRIIGLNRSKYVLVEFKRTENRNFNDILQILEEIRENGYIPVLAHPELYSSYRKIENMRKLKEIGVMLQIDSTSLYQRKIKQIITKMLNERLVDFVASDTHEDKKRNYIIYNKAYKKIKRKYGKEYTNIIFYENPLKIINKKAR